MQKNNDPEWIKFGEIIKTGSYDSSYYFTPAGGGSRVNVTPSRPIHLPEGTTNLKYQYTGNKFAVDFDARFGIKLRPTDAVKSAIEKARENDEESLNFYNIYTMGVKNSEGEYVNVLDKLQVNGIDSMYFPDDVWNELRQQEQAMTGTDNQHLRHGGQGIQLKEAVAHSHLIKKSGTPVSDVINGRSVVPYTLYMTEATSLNSNVISRENALKWEIVAPQNTGVFYDLLPKGTWVQKDSIKVHTTNVTFNGYDHIFARGEPCTFDVSFTPDWRDSGMTMMKISVQSPVDPNYFVASSGGDNYNIYSGYVVDFKVINPWDNILDHGRTMLNSAAYQTGKGVLADGLPDEGGKIDNKEWFKDVNGDNDPNDKQFLYSQDKVEATPLLATEISTNKMVKSMEQATFGVLSEVPVGGEYIYRLRYSVAKNTQARNVVLYDILENAYGDQPHWQGTFNRIDLEKAVEKGIDPVVYYSTRNDLNPKESPEDGDLTNGEIWTKEEPADKTTIKAVAIDLSKKTNGQDYIFPAESLLPIFIYMDAPKNGVPYMNPTVYAWNDVYVHGIKMMHGGGEVDINEKTDLVKVYLREVSLGIEKTSNPESGTFESPKDLRENGNKVEYTLKVKDSSAKDVARNVEVVDHIPDGLKLDTGDIRYRLNGGAESEIAADGPITLVREGQKLTFTIKTLSPGDEMEIILPAQVVKPEKLNQNVPVFQNTAEITKVGGREYGVRSNTVYHKTEFPTERTVVKNWDDSSDANGQRPESVTVRLFADGEPYGDAVKLSEATGWKHTWGNLPFSSERGDKVIYTLEEDQVGGYTAEVKETYNEDTGETGFQVRNTLETTKRTVKKSWSDGDDVLGIRPDHVEVQLMANGEPHGDPVRLDKSNNWTHQWEDLPLMSDGKKVAYTVSEKTEKPYRSHVYEDINEETGEVIFAISNALDLENKTVLKIWDDEDDKYGKRPETITVQLYKDGEPFGDPVTLSEDTGWHHTWENLIVDPNGDSYKYTVKEVLVEEYTSEIENIQREDGEVIGFLITNTFNKPPAEKISITGNKVWIGGPEEKPVIQIQLLQNGKAYGDPVSLENGTAAHTWNDLDANDAEDNPYVYTIEEVDVPQGYKAQKMSDGLTIVNTWIEPKDPAATPGEPGSKGSVAAKNKPKTGDETDLYWLFGLLLASGLLLAGLVGRRSREDQ
ncbi:MAG: Cna B-type domain-containing protein [Anaerovoracaceae bacterium]